MKLAQRVALKYLTARAKLWVEDREGVMFLFGAPVLSPVLAKKGFRWNAQEGGWWIPKLRWNRVKTWVADMVQNPDLLYTSPSTRVPTPPPQREERRYFRASLDNISRRKVVQMVNRVIDRVPTEGIHRDQYWRPVQQIWKAFERAGIPFGITKSEYEKERGVPVRKVWLFEVPFTNERGKPDIVYGRVVAAGAGSVEEPLESYDVVAYAN